MISPSIQILSRITGNDVRHEARACITSFDILKHIRTMRLKWLGSILRQEGGENRMLLRAVEMQSIMNQPGNLLSDAPTHNDFNHLMELVRDKAFWSEHIRFTLHIM